MSARAIILGRTVALYAIAIFAAGAAGLFVLVFHPGIELFLIAGILAMVFLKLMHVRESQRRPGVSTSAALIIYAALATVVTMTLRDALEPLDAALLGGYGAGMSFQPSEGNAKHGIRLFSGQSAVVLVLYAVFLLEGARRLGERFRLRLSPATALFVFVLFFSVVKLPPYSLDMADWGTLLASASAVSEYRWPYLHHYSVHYGFLSAGALALWLKAFALTPLGLAAFVSFLTATSAALAFILVARLTSSKAAALLAGALLVTNFYDMDTALASPGLGAVRSLFQIIAGLCLLWASLKPKGRLSILLAPFLFGAVCLWEPVYGIFMALSFWLVSAYRYFLRHERAALGQAIALLAGALFPVIIAAALRPPELSLFSSHTYGVLLGSHRQIMDGFGIVPQNALSAGLLAALFYVALAFIAYRQLSAGRGFTSMHLFFFATALLSPPWIACGLGSPGRACLNPLAWLLAPATAVIIYSAYRYSVMTRSRIRLFAVSIMAATPLLTMDLMKPIDAIGSFLTKYEEERAAWSGECAGMPGQGRDCGKAEEPGLARYARAAIDGSFGMGQAVGNEFGYYAPNLFLVRACMRGVPIISELAPVIHLRGGCAPPSKFLMPDDLAGKALIAEFVEELKTFPVVVYDERRAGRSYAEGLRASVKRELLDAGYIAAERHGVISVLVARGVLLGPGSCIICRPDVSSVNLSANAGRWTREAALPLRKKLFDWQRKPEWPDYVMSALVRSDGPAGLLFGASSSTSYHVFYIDPAKGVATLAEYHEQAGQSEILSAPLKQGISGQWHELEIVASNGHYQFFVDGQFAAEWAGAVMGSGTGLWDFGGSARFQEITIRKGPDTGTREAGDGLLKITYRR